MKDEKNEKMSDEEILKCGMDHLSEACCFLYELEDDKSIALAFMADAALRYGQAILQDRDPRLSEEFINEQAT